MHMRVFLHNWDMDIAQQIIWIKKLEEYDENPSYTYYEKHYDRIFPLDVYFYTNEIMCMQLTRAK